VEYPVSYRASASRVLYDGLAECSWTHSHVVLQLAGLYLALGFLFALAFAFRGAARIDGDAGEGSLGFRILILPGATALWPFLAYRWTRSQRADASAQADASNPSVRTTEAVEERRRDPILLAELQGPVKVRRRQVRISLITLCLLPLFVTLAILARPTSKSGTQLEDLDFLATDLGIVDGASLHDFTIRIEPFSNTSEAAVDIDAHVFYAKDIPDGLVLQLAMPDEAGLVFGPDALVYWQQEQGIELRDSAWLLGRVDGQGASQLMLPPPSIEEDGQIFVVNGLDGAMLGRVALPSTGSR
jgi:hypothetical protein